MTKNNMLDKMYESLLNAIILQGYNDYLGALVKNDRKTIKEVESSFMNHPWLFSHYSIEPEDILAHARKEIRHDAKANKRTILQDL